MIEELQNLTGDIATNQTLTGELDYRVTGGKVDDVLVDGTSVVENKIANIDLTGKQDVLTAGDNITIENNVISATGGSDANVKVYHINYTDSNTQYTQYFTQWFEDYKNGIEPVINIYHNYTVGIGELQFTYANGNGSIKIMTSALFSDNEPTKYGITYRQFDYNSRRATITNDVITLSGGWALSVSSYAPSSSSKILGTNNTEAYTPTGDYNPATKKYVDDIVGDIESLLGGI